MKNRDAIRAGAARRVEAAVVRCVLAVSLVAVGACDASSRPAPTTPSSPSNPTGPSSLPPNYAPRMGCEMSWRPATLPTCAGVRVTLRAIDVRHFRPPHNGVRVAATIEGNDGGARFLIVPAAWALADATHGGLPEKLETVSGERSSLFGPTLNVHTSHPSLEIRRLGAGASTIDPLHVDAWCFLPDQGRAQIELVLAKDVRLGSASVDGWLPREVAEPFEVTYVETPEHAPITLDGGCRVVATIEGTPKTL